MRFKARIAIGLALPVTLLVAGPSAAALRTSPATYTYPVAVPGAQVDTYFGTQVPDPYRWLENPKSAQTKAWIAAEQRLATDYLGGLPSRAARHKQLVDLVNYGINNTPTQRGRKLFWTGAPAGVQESILYVAETATAKPRVLLNSATLSPDASVGLSDWLPSWNGRYLAYAVSTGGSDWESIRIKSVATGRDYPETIDWVKFPSMSWDPADSGFYYSAYPKPKNPLQAVNRNQKVYFHRLGTDPAADTLVFADPRHPLRGLQSEVDPTAKTLWIYTNDSAGPNNGLYYRSLDAPRRPLVPLFLDHKAEYYPIAQIGNHIWMLTNRDAPNRRVVTLDLRHPAARNWKTVIGEQAETMDVASVVGDRLVTTFLKDATNRIRIFDLSGRETVTAPLPGLGTTGGFEGGDDRRQTYYSFTSYTSPTTVMRLDVQTGRSTVWRKAVTSFDTSQVTTDQVFVTSKDGTQVPAFIVHRKDVLPTGDNPTLLYGYGGFGYSITPTYSSRIAAWVQGGGVYVEAVLRGGGEYGYDWYEAGTQLKKQNVFDDFIATAQWLIDQHWTSKQRLAINGDSNGGLLVGAVLTQRPDLFGAAVAGVGVLDMLRYQDFTVGSGWAGDYGLSSDSPEMFTYLLGYSPLHNVESGVSYPATLITTADHDDRVVPAHSYKFAATLQADSVGQAPIVIRIDAKAGHGGGSGLAQTIDLWSDELAFLDAHVGNDPVVPTPRFSKATA
jgi:prolyl oligopeptidase